MSEKLLKLIEKYEAENREIEELCENDNISDHMMIRYETEIEKNQKFIDDLNSLLYSAM